MARTLRHCLSAALLVCGLSHASAAQDHGPAGTVTLTRTEYDRLLDLASRQPRPPDGAPLPAALTRAEIKARVEGGIVRATMNVDGQVFQTGSLKVPLISNATLLDARTADRPLPLVAEGSSHVAVVSGPASFSATLEWGSAVTATPGRGAFLLPVPPAGSVTATFDMPGEQSDLRVSPGLVVRRTSAGGRTIVEATLDPGSPTQVWWSARETTASAAPRDARLLSDVKTLVTIGDADIRLLTLVDVTVVQGEPAEIVVRIPAGYEVTGVTGASLDKSDTQGDRVGLSVSNPTRRRHQFLISLERQHAGGSFKLETAFPTLPSTERETGEVAIEGIGTLAVSSGEIPGMRRMDVREVDPALASVARQSLLAAYRYRRAATGTPALALDVTRFPDAAVLAAIAERAVATTLVTSEGRALTEVSLCLRNRAQPFMKVMLPTGATMLSVEVAGAPAKPVEGADGLRVPLLRPGFKPDGLYTVSFVYLHSGTPFARKGQMQMTLPKMDLPVSVVEWELFVPQNYRADRFDGTAIAAALIERSSMATVWRESCRVKPAESTGRRRAREAAFEPAAGADRSGARSWIRTAPPSPARRSRPRVRASGEPSSPTRTGGTRVAGMPAGPVTVTSQLQGFKTLQQSVALRAVDGIGRLQHAGGQRVGNGQRRAALEQGPR